MQEKTGNGHHIEFDQLVEDLKAVMRDGQQLLRASLGTLSERAKAGAAATGRFARERPYETLGMAFGLGLVAGLLMAGAFRGRPELEED